MASEKTIQKCPSRNQKSVQGRDGFLAKIREPTLAAQTNKTFPILHIETHGWSDKSGLAFPDDSSLS